MRHSKRGTNGRFIKLVESAATATKGKLQERGGVSGTGARRNVTLISAGWGSSGYYSRQLLERDGPKAWPAGTQMYLDHPSMTEEHDRPERSVKDLAGVLTNTPHMMGNDLVAEAEIFEHWRPVVNALANDIGLSIRAEGAYEDGTAEGRSGRIIEELTEGISVDFVTRAGAGGKVGDLIESARKQDVNEAENALASLRDAMNEALEKFGSSLTLTPGPQESRRFSGDDDHERSLSMDEKTRLSQLEESDRQHKDSIREKDQKITELTESGNKEKDRADRAEDALMLETAKRVVNEVLAKGQEGDHPLPKLPDRATERVKEASVRDKLPLTEDGKLDQDKLTERVRSAVKSEHEYLAGASPSGGVEGMGASVEESDPPSGGGNGNAATEANQKQLIEAFKRQGMSDEAAKTAAEGR